MDDAKAKLAKSKLSSFFENDDDDSFPQTTVGDAKLSLFSNGVTRKSKREKEQEAAEAKQREEEAKAATAYAEFIDAFEGEGVGRQAAATFVRADTKSKYGPTGVVPTGPRADRKSVSPPPAGRPKGRRAMDSFLEEIKREQAQREAKHSRSSGGRSVTSLAAFDGQSGSRDRGDQLTSNIFVANLPTNISEEGFGNFFAKAGPVGSVKIMWPREAPPPDMSRRHGPKTSNLSGFVSFMERKDAEEAIRAFDGSDWEGFSLRVGWSKAVPVAPKAKYVSAEAMRRGQRSSSRSRSRSGRSNRRSRQQSSGSSGSRRRRSRSRSPLHHEFPTSSLVEDDVTDTFVRAVAAEVKGHGSSYEKFLMDKERTNPKYAFLHYRNRRHSFYRDLTEDSRHGPEFDDEGYNSMYSTDSGEESERERVHKTSLGRLARKRFEAMLRALSGTRGEIARCMSFCLEHAEAANEIADVIISSLLVDGTPVPRKVARLHLICDILHNSAATLPSAWKFRPEFQPRLGIVFDHLGNIYHSFPGRMTGEIFKKQITAVIDIWEDWIVFPPDFTAELRRRLEGERTEAGAKLVHPTPTKPEDTVQPETMSKFKTSTFKAAADLPADDVHASDIEGIDGEPLGGQAVDEDLDGVDLDDVDGEPMDEDLDGSPIAEDMDGEPLIQDDLDGEPI